MTSKKQLKEEIRVLQMPLSSRQLIMQACAWPASHGAWFVIAAMRGPDSGGKFQSPLKEVLTKPVREWAMGAPILVSKRQLEHARALLAVTGVVARRLRHYLTHIHNAVQDLVDFNLVPKDQMWYADAVLEATEENFKPRALVDAIEKHQGETE